MAMPAGITVPLEEYLSTVYEPDREWVNGELIERNTGEADHAGLQYLIGLALGPQRSRTGTHVFTELRVQISSEHFLVPDLAVTLQKVKDRILREPPFLCIEIVSPEDRLSRMERKIQEYLRFGVRYVWLVDPRERKAWTYTEKGRIEASQTLTTSDPTLSIELEPLFADLSGEVGL